MLFESLAADRRQRRREKSMKKVDTKTTDDLRPEYKRSDFGNLVHGKYAARLSEETDVVVLEPDVAKAPTRRL